MPNKQQLQQFANAYLEGAEAYNTNRAMRHNPYKESTKQHEGWARGYIERKNQVQHLRAQDNG